MRSFLTAALVAGGLSLGSSFAQAAPLAAPSFDRQAVPALDSAAALATPSLEDGIIAVSGGCGPGGFRGRDGRCYARRPPPPRYRRCPPGYRPTPYACRRIF